MTTPTDPGPFIVGESDRPLRVGRGGATGPAAVAASARNALSDDERRRYARVMAAMPFAGDLRDHHVEYVGDVLDVLERFAERLYDHAGRDADRKAELADVRHDLAAVGRIMRRAALLGDEWQDDEQRRPAAR